MIAKFYIDFTLRRSIILLFFLFFQALYSLEVYAVLKMDVSIIHKKGVDKDFVLVSELHSVESIIAKKNIELYMKDGVKFSFYAGFAWKDEVYGPDSKIIISGALYDQDGTLMELFDLNPIIVELGSTHTISKKNNKGEIVEISLTPRLE